jgi:hypothetical protein
MVRYLLASDSVVTFGIEGTAYSKAASADNYFGLVREDIDPPNPNEQTPMATGGKSRGVYVNSPDPKEYEFDVPVQPVDANLPIETALGTRTDNGTVDPDGNAGSGDEYDEVVFTEADRLPTMTVAHWQDGNLEAYYTGCKSSLSVSASQGEPVGVTFNVMAAGLDPTTSFSDSPSAAPSLSIPQESPFRFWMLEDVTVSRTSGGANLGPIETATSVDFSLDNGLEANHHGRGRDAYSISEETAEEKHDHTLGITQTDYEWYEEAYNNGEPMDFEFVFNKNPDSTAARSDLRDALYIRLNGTTVSEANSPAPGEGKLEPDISLMPRSMELEIHQPA